MVRRLIPLFVIAGLIAAYFIYRWQKNKQPYEWSGTVEARTITVGSRTGGRVKEVLVREGDVVEAGSRSSSSRRATSRRSGSRRRGRSIR